MQSCHTVDRISGYNGKMRHFYLPVPDNSHLTDLLLIARILLLNL